LQAEFCVGEKLRLIFFGAGIRLLGSNGFRVSAAIVALEPHFSTRVNYDMVGPFKSKIENGNKIENF
jgi:hypothetical protein